MAPNRIDDFIAALQDEIEAVKKSKSGATHVVGGRLTSQIGDNYIYTFTATRFFTADDDAPALIALSGETFDCSIVATDGLSVQLAVAGAVAARLGSAVPSAQLSSNRSLILQRLVNKFKEAKTKNPDQFNFAEEVFAGTAKRLVRVGTQPSYTYQPENAPNASQAAAINNSFSSSLAVIWGPPGTGKTRTIARAVEAHLNAGRRVLLVSHANTAVDAALEDIADQLRSTYYSQGKIIRLGLPKNKNLPREYPLVILEKVVAASNAHLLDERAQIEAELRPVEDAMQQWQALRQAADRARRLEKEIQRPEQVSNQQQRLQQVLADISHAQRQLQQAHHDLGQAQRGIDAATQETHIKDLNIFISTRQRFIDEIKGQLQQAEAAALANEAKLEEAHLELDRLMESTGLTPNDVGKYIDAYQPKVVACLNRINEIEKIIENGAGKVIADAQVIGTTFSNVFLSNLLAEQSFDIVIVDQASMVPMPHLYWALGKAKSAATIVGDFNQLPPIVVAESKIAKKWLGESIFDELNIATVNDAQDNELVSMLDTQYRMAPEIADISSKLFYGGMLQSAESTKLLGLADSVFADKKIIVIDTSHINPWCISPATGSRINLYSAGLAINLTKRLLREHPQITVGVATPYKPQAELIAKAVNEAGLAERALVSTVQPFQGGQSTAIIFDCVDGKGSKKSMLADFVGEQLNSAASNNSAKSNPALLLNVALTRAQGLFVLLVNRQYFVDNYKGGILCQFIDKLSLAGRVINARQIDDCFTAQPLDDLGMPIQAARRVTSSAGSSNASVSKSTQVFGEQDFWSAFRLDISATSQSVLIISPYLTVKRTAYFIDQLAAMVTRGVKLTVCTKPSEDHAVPSVRKEAEEAAAQLQNIGITVIKDSKFQQRIIILDDHITWEGNLSLLSQNDYAEQMRRLESASIATEVRKSLRL